MTEDYAKIGQAIDGGKYKKASLRKLQKYRKIILSEHFSNPLPVEIERRDRLLYNLNQQIEHKKEERRNAKWKTWLEKIIIGVIVGLLVLFLWHLLRPQEIKIIDHNTTIQQVPLSQDRTPKNQPHQKQSTIDITAFDSKTNMVLYNTGDRSVFLSHLSLRSEGFGYSGVIFINKTIEGKSRLVHDLKIPTMDLSKWAVRSISEDSWQNLLRERRLNESECIQWHFFVPDDSGYQTIKKFHGRNFREVPIEATLYFRSGQDNHQNSRDVKVFAVPFLNQACVAPNGTFTY